jgi:hypothetical protein
MVPPVGTRLTDDTLRMLAAHTRQVHPDVPLPQEARAGVVLACFTVSEAPADG